MSNITYCSANCRSHCERNRKLMTKNNPYMNNEGVSWFDFSLECPRYDPVIVLREEFKQETDEAYTHD